MLEFFSCQAFWTLLPQNAYLSTPELKLFPKHEGVRRSLLLRVHSHEGLSLVGATRPRAVLLGSTLHPPSLPDTEHRVPFPVAITVALPGLSRVREVTCGGREGKSVLGNGDVNSKNYMLLCNYVVCVWCIKVIYSLEQSHVWLVPSWLCLWNLSRISLRIY